MKQVFVQTVNNKIIEGGHSGKDQLPHNAISHAHLQKLKFCHTSAVCVILCIRKNTISTYIHQIVDYHIDNFDYSEA